MGFSHNSLVSSQKNDEVAHLKKEIAHSEGCWGDLSEKIIGERDAMRWTEVEEYVTKLKEEIEEVKSCLEYDEEEAEIVSKDYLKKLKDFTQWENHPALRHKVVLDDDWYLQHLNEDSELIHPEKIKELEKENDYLKTTIHTTDNYWSSKNLDLALEIKNLKSEMEEQNMYIVCYDEWEKNIAEIIGLDANHTDSHEVVNTIKQLKKRCDILQDAIDDPSGNAANMLAQSY